MFRTDICIAGAGIIGLSLALELQGLGLRVIVVDAGPPLQQASSAAAGMLAVDDPANPPELHALAQLSASLYPGFLDSLLQLGGIAVPLQTSQTLQSLSHREREHNHEPLPASLLGRLASASDISIEDELPSGYMLLREHSIDPRQLAASLHAAITAAPVRLVAGAPVAAIRNAATSVLIETPTHRIEAAHFIDCTGAWASATSGGLACPIIPIIPIKGQMLSLALPAAFPLHKTVRTDEIYIVPRTSGPGAGRAIVGATVEDAGFDKTVHPSQIASLHRAAAALLPPLAKAAMLESWAGLRPATSDRLPLLGPHPAKPRHWIASGHFRNGILLAPATARVLAQLLCGETPSVSLDAFDPARPAVHTHETTDIRPAAVKRLDNPSQPTLP